MGCKSNASATNLQIFVEKFFLVIVVYGVKHQQHVWQLVVVADCFQRRQLAAVEESDARHEDGVACHTDQHVGVGYKLYRSAVDEDVVVALAQAFKHLVEGVVFKQFCRVGADGARRQDVDSRAFVVHNQFVEVGARSVEI